MRHTAIALAVVGALVLPAAAAAQSREVRKLQLEQYFDFETVSNPRISPDGTQIIYTRGWMDKVNDRRGSALWIMNADGSKNRFLTNGSDAIWAPDGTRIAFRREREPKGSQIWVRWMDAEGATTQITRVEENPSNLVWTPDGKSIAFTMLVPKRETWQIRMPPRPEGARWAEPPRIVESLTYRADRQGFIEQGLRQIFIVPAEGVHPARSPMASTNTAASSASRTTARRSFSRPGGARTGSASLDSPTCTRRMRRRATCDS